MLFALHWTYSLFDPTQAPSPLHTTTNPITTNNYIAGILPPNSTKHLDISLRSSNRNATVPFLGALLYEDISHSGDGRLYSELLYNRAFQGLGVKVGHALRERVWEGCPTATSCMRIILAYHSNPCSMVGRP